MKSKHYDYSCTFVKQPLSRKDGRADQLGFAFILALLLLPHTEFLQFLQQIITQVGL